jgi:calcium-dependent protein kinase
MGNKSSSSGKNAIRQVQDHLVKRDDHRKVDEKYDIVEKALAEGSATQIKRASSKKYHTKTQRGSGVAIKLYDGKAEVPPDLRKEAEILSQCDHPHIVKLYEVARVDRKGNMSLVMELCTGGSLADRLPYTEEQAKHIMRQVCSAVTYLHSKYIVHRDIEMTNILYETPDPNSDVKLIDFGCATKLDLVVGHPGAFTFLKEKTGSVHIMAPEVIQGRYGPKCDVWSLGVLTYMLLNNGEHPFKGSTV